MRSRYHRILGVPENATKTEIKRAFRKKALKYHPDVNKSPNAGQVFMELQKAYEALMEDRPYKPQPKPRPTQYQQPPKKEPYKRTKPPTEEALRRAAERARLRKEQIIREGLQYFHNYKKSLKYKLTTVIIAIGVVMAVLLVCDHFLPYGQFKAIVKAKTYEPSNMRGGKPKMYIVLHTKDRIEVPSQVFDHIRITDVVRVRYSKVFGLPMRVESVRQGYLIPLDMLHLIHTWFWFFVIVLLAPLIRYQIQRPHVSFYFADFSTRVVIPIIVTFLIVSLITTQTF